MMVFNCSWGVIVFGNGADLSFTAMQVEAWLKSDFVAPVQICDDSDIFSRRFLHILKGIVSDILFIIYDQVLAGS